MRVSVGIGGYCNTTSLYENNNINVFRQASRVHFLFTMQVIAAVAIAGFGQPLLLPRLR